MLLILHHPPTKKTPHHQQQIKNSYVIIPQTDPYPENKNANSFLFWKFNWVTNFFHKDLTFSNLATTKNTNYPWRKYLNSKTDFTVFICHV